MLFIPPQFRRSPGRCEAAGTIPVSLFAVVDQQIGAVHLPDRHQVERDEEKFRSENRFSPPPHFRRGPAGSGILRHSAESLRDTSQRKVPRCGNPQRGFRRRLLWIVKVEPEKLSSSRRRQSETSGLQTVGVQTRHPFHPADGAGEYTKENALSAGGTDAGAFD